MIRTLWVALAWMAGCDLGNDGKDDVEGPHCEDTVTVVGIDEDTELGFAARALLDLAEGTHDELFTWARDDSTTPLALTVTHSGGEARFVASEEVYPEDGTSIAIGVICDDRVEVDVEVDFVTTDGAFAESWELALTGLSGDGAAFHRELDPDGLTGTYDMADDITEPTYDDRSLWVAGSFDANGAAGTVSGQVSGSDPDCDGGECTAWAAQVNVGAWGS